MSARRLILAVLVSMCSLAGVLSFAGADAQAAIIHEYLSQITETPATGPHGEAVASHGLLEGPVDMTAGAGQLWTLEKGESQRIDELTTTGGFEFQLSWPAPLAFPSHLAIGHATSGTELYTSSSEARRQVVAVLGPSGNLQATWTGADAPSAFCEGIEFCSISSIAVDNSQSLGDWAAGDVYVAVARYGGQGKGVVDVFEPEAGGKEKYVGQLPGPEPGDSFAEGSGRYLAVDQSNGDVLVGEGAETPEKAVSVFEPSAVVGQYTLKLKLTGPPLTSFGEIYGVAGDDGDIYVLDRSAAGEVVDQFSSEGVYLGHLTGTPSGPFAVLRSLAVEPVNHEVYVSDYRPERAAGVIDVFGPSLVVPDVASGSASSVKGRSATLNGTVDPDGVGAATCRFAWGTSTTLGKVAPCEPEGVADGSSPVAVHAQLSGLAPDTTYYYRLQAGNAAGANPGEASQDQQFSTLGAGIQQESASTVTSGSATLGAKVDPDDALTTYYFQYGTSLAYGTSLPAPPGLSLGAAKGYQPVSVHLQGLAAGTTYHYRVLAVSEPGGELVIDEGPDATFTTGKWSLRRTSRVRGSCPSATHLDRISRPPRTAAASPTPRIRRS
jgi:hypothetical protein